MDRKSGSCQNWMKEVSGIMEKKSLDRRKELIRQYKEMKTEAGVYQIKEYKKPEGPCGPTPNLKTMNGKPMMLNGGVHKNKKLQEEWNKIW